jgi:hypothetical protein
MDNATSIPILNTIQRKKWSKPEKIYLPLILDDNADENQIDTPEQTPEHTSEQTPDNIIIHKISKWRLKTHKFVNISYNKLSKKDNKITKY